MEIKASQKIWGKLKGFVPYIIIVIVVVLIRTFIMTPVKVNGASMNNTLKDGDILILNKLDKKFERFDIVVINLGNTKIVKRIIGLQGESVSYENDILYIDGQPLTDVSEDITDDFSLESLYGYTYLPDDYYFVMGDNRNNSSDSRDYRIGIIPKSKIEGTTSIRIFPFTKIGSFK